MSLAAMISDWMGLIGRVLHHFLVIFYAPLVPPFMK